MLTPWTGTACLQLRARKRRFYRIELKMSVVSAAFLLTIKEQACIFMIQARIFSPCSSGYKIHQWYCFNESGEGRVEFFFSSYQNVGFVASSISGASSLLWTEWIHVSWRMQMLTPNTGLFWQVRSRCSIILLLAAVIPGPKSDYFFLQNTNLLYFRNLS